MELVSAAKMRRAIEAVLKTRSYANLSWLTVLDLAKAAEKNQKLHELLRPRQTIKKVGIILISSNRGLCGGFNANIINKAIKSIDPTLALPLSRGGEKPSVEFVILGKKGAAVHRRFGFNLAAEFDKPDVVTEIAEVLPVAKMAIKDYLDGRYDKIMLAYTDFISAAKQIPRVKQLLPVTLTSNPLSLRERGESGAERSDGVRGMQEYIFEPNAKEVLNEMIPRLLEIQMFQAMLESNASEHSARMLAMRNASDAANDMIDDLTLTYNKARQANITREIAEIAGGAQALQS
jgi:F-type H+-transporting ATPase subunit gamma